MAKMSPEAKESKKMQYRRTVKRRQEQEHEMKMAVVKWFTENDEAPYIAMVIAGGTTGVLARMLSEFLKVSAGPFTPVTDSELLSGGWTQDQIDKLRAGEAVWVTTPPHPTTGQTFTIPVTLEYINRYKRMARDIKDPSQLDDVMGTLGGGLAGFGASILFLKAVFGKEGARGVGSVIAAATVCGLGTAATAAIVGKLADDV